KTKNGTPHAIPVPPIAAELIESIKPNVHGWFFPSAKDPKRPVSHGTLYSFMRRQRDRGVIPVVTNRDLRRTWKTPRWSSRCPQGTSRPYPKPRVAGCEFEELRPLELHARKTRRYGEMGQIRSRDAGQEAAAEAGRITKGPVKSRPATFDRTPDYDLGVRSS